MKIIKTSKYVEAAIGKFKFQCDSCKEFTWLSNKERGRRAIPRCQYCGSTYLEPVTEHAENRMKGDSDASHNMIDDVRDQMNIQRKEPLV
jgi:transposase-like protein